jgi:uncharacterized protein YndB with AHSA1/START domain
MAHAKEKTPATGSFRKSDREFVMTRTFNAPRKLVFKAYTDPEAIPEWWGPRNLVTRVEKMDVRVGGTWRYIQRAPNGNEYAFNGVYKEIVAPSKVVSTFEFEGMPGHIVVDTVTLEEVNGKTTITVLSLFQSKEDLDGMLQSGMEGGANESYERFEELLASYMKTESIN